MNGIEKLRRRFYQLLNALSRCRFAVYILAIAAVLFCLLPQGQDALFSLGTWSAFFFFGLAIVWSLFLWFVARRMLTMAMSASDAYILQPSDFGPDQAIIKLVPRGFAIAVFLLLIPAFLKVGRPLLAVVAGCIAVGVAAFFAFAPRVLGKDTQRAFAIDIDEQKRLAMQERTRVFHRFFNGDDHASWMWIVLLSFSFFLVVSGFWLMLYPVTQFLNGAHILALHLTMYTLAGAVLFVAGMKSGVPMFFLLSLLWFGASYVNDNHELRVTSFGVETPTNQNLSRSSIDDYTSQWMSRHAAEASKPLVIVVTEGGGIRAAYWTSKVLEGISERDECKQVFEGIYAYSGVSGGSVGACAFVGAQQVGEPKLASAFLKNDFLTLGLAVMLGGDMLQRFVPFRILAIAGRPNLFDRARAFERVLRAGWRKELATLKVGRENPEENEESKSATAINDFDLDEPYLSLWSEGADVPLLLFNSTLQETGQQVVISPVDLTSEGKGLLTDGHDFFSWAAPKYETTPMTTAAYCSARFPYFGPPGSVQTRKGEWVHLLDGGYFDNSGAHTALDLLRYLQSNAEVQNKVKVVVIALTCNARTFEATANTTGGLFPMPSGEELSTPPVGIYNTWDRHSHYAMRSLKREVQEAKGLFVELALKEFQAKLETKEERELKFVLGWSLSEKQTGVLDRAAKNAVDDLCEKVQTFLKTEDD